MARKKPSELMYEVAELIERNLNGEEIILNDKPVPYWGACELLKYVHGSESYKRQKETAQRKFSEMFYNGPIFWFGNPWKSFNSFTPNEENQTHRLMSVLMTAVILESERNNA